MTDRCASLRVKIKQGERFEESMLIAAAFPDGHFAGSTLSGEVRDINGAFIATLACTWADPLTTREIKMVAPTDTWPIGRLFSDVRIHRALDGLTKYSGTVKIRVIPSYTKTAP